MSKHTHKLLVLLVFIAMLVPFHRVASRGMDAETDSLLYLPLVAKNYPPVVLTDWWVGNAEGFRRSAFLPAEQMRYIVVGENYTDTPLDVSLRWHRSGPCGDTDVFTGTLTVEPGLWVHSLEESAPDCLGTYTNTVQFAHDELTTTHLIMFDVVTYTSEVVVNSNQGFDKCALPTVSQMHTWAVDSPYNAFNIYLGGLALSCNNPQLNAEWVWQVSQQGWEFILTWVGPLSPCFNTTKPKISLDPSVARQQGHDEADLAITAAENLDLLGDKVIYYDLEGYTDDAAGTCSDAVDAFITGWTERLHERGFKAGAYGSPARSYISDWWDNTPPPDDIWFALWRYDTYTTTASVWVEAYGLTNDMWPDNQRIRQYAGDHYETWGGENLNGKIDSNVLLGEVTAITTTSQGALPSQPLVVPLGAQIPLWEATALPDGNGWALQGNRILWRSGETGTWADITPLGVSNIRGVTFPDAAHGFLVSARTDGTLTLYKTADSGQTWDSVPLHLPAVDVSAVYLDFVNPQTGWVVLKMVSSSAFSIGRLFATTDGGQTWDERQIPLGEPVQFSDALHGWVSGGPMGDEFYRTDDGGRTWSPVEQAAYRAAFALPQIANLPANTVTLSRMDGQTAWALTRNGVCGGYIPLGERTPPDGTAPLPCALETHLWMTTNGGQTWVEITP